MTPSISAGGGRAVHDVIVVGSGLAGVGATLELCERGLHPVVIDVGHLPSPHAVPRENFYAYRKHNDLYELVVGDELHGFANLLSSRQVPVKLTSPHAAYVTRGADAFAAVDESEFSAIQSFAVGGLANAWGAGCYRFNDEDLEGFPISAADLEPYFDRLTAEIGIAGTDDDLTPFFGSTNGLLPPIRLGRNVGALYERYRRHRAAARKRGIAIGRARVGVLTEARGERPALRYDSFEFFAEDKSLYTPRYTLQRLVGDGSVTLHTGLLVRSWRETENGVEVEANDVETGERHAFTARALILAAGAINTAKIVLAAHDDYDTRLDLRENPALQFPLVLPLSIGKRLQTDAFGLVQLNLVWDSRSYGERLQASIMEITAPARAEFFAGFPYAARSNISLIRYMLPAMIVMQLFFPGSAQPPARLSLQENGRLRIDGHPNTLAIGGLRPLLGFLLRLGVVTLPRLIVRVPTGHAVHYACTVPMKRDPQRYECYPDGRLQGTRAVYVGDSAGFTHLPAKNMSFAMMANAMRVATCVVKEVVGR